MVPKKPPVPDVGNLLEMAAAEAAAATSAAAREAAHGEFAKLKQMLDRKKTSDSSSFGIAAYLASTEDPKSSKSPVTLEFLQAAATIKAEAAEAQEEIATAIEIGAVTMQEAVADTAAAAADAAANAGNVAAAAIAAAAADIDDIDVASVDE
jgi:hypothetical protein